MPEVKEIQAPRGKNRPFFGDFFTGRLQIPPETLHYKDDKKTNIT